MTNLLHFADSRRKGRLLILVRDWYRPQEPLFSLTSVITASKETSEIRNIRITNCIKNNAMLQ